MLNFSMKILLGKLCMITRGIKGYEQQTLFQKRFLPAEITLFILCLCLCQQALPLSYESTDSDNSVMTSSPKWVTSMTLKVTSISPYDGAGLTNFPVNLEIKVTRGDFPVQGARVQFWIMGGSHDAEMHNAFLTMTDSSGYAHLTLLNQNTLDPGPYIWYADAILPGFRGGASKVSSFTNSFAGTKGIIVSSSTVSTNQDEYVTLSNTGASVSVHGNVDNYHIGQPIILKIKSPSGKIVQIVEYGTYLGAFQSVYKLGQNSELGQYIVTVYHNYFVSSSSKFRVVK